MARVNIYILVMIGCKFVVRSCLLSLFLFFSVVYWHLAVQWLHFMIWSFSMAWVGEAIGRDKVPFIFVCCLLYSVMSGWNLDLADQGYKVKASFR
jgi:hypothetical protein